MRRSDRAIGIVLGIVLGVGIVIAFVFFGSEGTIDAPRIDRGSAGSAQTTPRSRPKPPKHEPKPGPSTLTAKVPIVGGAPPVSGPAQVDAKEGDKVRLEVSTDAAVELELLGYGVSTTVEPGKPTTIAFTASKPGNFPLIVAASHIAVAQVGVAK